MHFLLNRFAWIELHVITMINVVWLKKYYYNNTPQFGTDISYIGNPDLTFSG